MKKLWIIDNGHGNNTPGKRSPVWDDGTQLLEWEFSRNISGRICELLKQHNIEHILLVPEDYDVSLAERVRRANKIHQARSESVLVSIHGNAAVNPVANGVEAFTSVGETQSDAMASVFLKHLEKLQWKMRYDKWSDGDPDKEAHFYILKHTSMPAILTENGFYTNPEECRKMMDPYWQDSIAQLHVAAIREIENSKDL